MCGSLHTSRSLFFCSFSFKSTLLWNYFERSPLPWSQTCRSLDQNDTSGSPGSPACRHSLQILGLVSLHGHTSQFLIINLFLCIHASYWFCFSGGPWLKHKQSRAFLCKASVHLRKGLWDHLPLLPRSPSFIQVIIPVSKVDPPFPLWSFIISSDSLAVLASP